MPGVAPQDPHASHGAQVSPPPVEASPLDDPEAPRRVIDVAVQRFSQAPFSETKLEAIARESGISKRMIHYYFNNKKGLYLRAVSEALERLKPESGTLFIDSNIPVDGMRATVHAIFSSFEQHPEAVALLRMESTQRIIKYSELSPLADHSPVILHLDKLLMLGQDAGAFRPGISAYDILFLISAVLSYRQKNPELVANLYGVDLTNPDNTAGAHRMTVDLVLAFLTANIPPSGHESYLTSEPTADDHSVETSATGIIYG